ncbi:hypothetical protein [Archaeoglobus sp.]
MLGRILSVVLAVSIIYFVMTKFGLNAQFVPFALAFYLAYELSFKIRKFRSIFLAFAIFFTAKVVFENVPLPIEINELYLLLFLIFLSLAWVDFAQPFTASMGLIASALFGYLMLPNYYFVIVLPVLAVALTTLPSFRYEGVLAWRRFALAVSIILAIYVLIRPLFSDRPGIVSLFDWIIVLGIALKAFSNVRFEKAEIVEEKTKRFKEISETLDDAIERFLKYGDKIPLVVALSKLLSDSLSFEKVCEVVKPLVEYRDLRIPKPAFRWEVERIERRNLERRRRVVEEIMRGVKT